MSCVHEHNRYNYANSDATEKIFSNPSLKETEDYITGRFS